LISHQYLHSPIRDMEIQSQPAAKRPARCSIATACASLAVDWRGDSSCNLFSTAAIDIRRIPTQLPPERQMAKINGLDKMSYAELADMETQIERLKGEKQNAERSVLRQRLVDIAKGHGFDINDLFGKGRKGTVAVKYRDPKNPENTWTGRGRMPRWMVAATKGGKTRKEDFLL
jgi:DNA-binding protein H-NS